MPIVRFTSHLKRFFPTLENNPPVNASTVAEVVIALNQLHPGFADYIVDEHGRLRKHVNIFVDESLIYDKENLLDAVSDQQTVFIMQSLSGG
jgi:hypothetical protein